MATTETAAPVTASVLSVLRRIATAPTVGPLVALVLTMAFFSVKSDRFLEAQNISLILQQVMVVGVLAIGQTLVILTAGIDLSCGTVMALGQIVMTKLAVSPASPRFLRCCSGCSRASPSACSTAGWSPASGFRRSSSRWGR